MSPELRKELTAHWEARLKDYETLRWSSGYHTDMARILMHNAILARVVRLRMLPLSVANSYSLRYISGCGVL